MGEDECLPMLAMASDDQKQYLLDLVSWEKDRMDLEKTSTWLGRLVQADPEGLAKWLFSKGESLAYYYLFKNIQVEIRSEDDDHRDFGESFFTLDDVFYVRVPQEEIKEKTIMEEYYSFLYDLAIKKNYGHSSQLTSDEKKYCERLLSHTTSKYKSNELYLPLMKNILRNQNIK